MKKWLVHFPSDTTSSVSFIIHISILDQIPRTYQTLAREELKKSNYPSEMMASGSEKKPLHSSFSKLRK